MEGSAAIEGASGTEVATALVVAGASVAEGAGASVLAAGAVVGSGSASCSALQPRAAINTTESARKLKERRTLDKGSLLFSPITRDGDLGTRQDRGQPTSVAQYRTRQQNSCQIPYTGPACTAYPVHIACPHGVALGRSPCWAPRHPEDGTGAYDAAHDLPIPRTGAHPTAVCSTARSSRGTREPAAWRTWRPLVLPCRGSSPRPAQPGPGWGLQQRPGIPRRGRLPK